MCAERRAPTQDTGAALASACAALKILPLPGVTIFPGAPLPLRIFESRYRALVAEALATDRILAIPMLVSEEAASAEPRGDPPDRWRRPDRGGAGLPRRPLRHPGPGDRPRRAPRRAGDGQALAGVPGRGARRRLPAGGAASLGDEVEALGQLVLDLVGVLPEESGVGQLAHAVAHLKNPGSVADIVAAAAVGDAPARQRILEAVEVGERLELVKSEVAAVLLVLSRGRTADA